MNTAIVMLGSNFHKEGNLERTKELLSEVFEITGESRILQTKARGKKSNSEDYLNQAITLLSADSAKETQRHFKHIEDLLGRSPLTNMMGDVPIDIDLIFWNGVQKRNDYDRFDFVKELVDELLDKQ